MKIKKNPQEGTKRTRRISKARVSFALPVKSDREDRNFRDVRNKISKILQAKNVRKRRAKVLADED